MGIGVVMLAGSVFYGFFALIASLGLRRVLPARNVPDASALRTFATFFPFAWMGWFLACFVVFSAWCEAVGVDPGIGDSWEVPLSNGCSLVMIDVTDDANISCRRPLFDATFDRLEIVEDRVFGHLSSRSLQHGFGVVDLKTARLERFDSLSALVAAKGSAVTFQTPNEAYRERRPQAADNVFRAVTLVLPALAFVGLWRRLRRFAAAAPKAQ